MNFEIGISPLSLPLVLTLAALMLFRRKTSVLIDNLPSVGFAISALAMIMAAGTTFWLPIGFTIYSAINLLQIKKGFSVSGGKLMQMLVVLQGIFVVECLGTDSVFKILWGLTASLFIQMLRNYLATECKKMTTVELASYWLVLLIVWPVALLHPDFMMQTLVNGDLSRGLALLLIGVSSLQVLFLYLPWKGYSNIVELGWLNTNLFFHLLLQVKVIFATKLFYPQLFVGAYAANGVRWIYLLLPLVAFIYITKAPSGLRRVAASNYFAATLLLLFYSLAAQDLEHVLFIAIIILGLCHLLQTYAYQTNTLTLQLRSGLKSRVLLVVSLFLPLISLNGALRAFFPQIYAGIFRWEDYATLFYFPSLLTLIFMTVSIVNALILCNDKLMLNHQDVWVLRKSDIVIAFSLLPFIFLGIYPSPLYNYIQKYFIFP